MDTELTVSLPPWPIARLLAEAVQAHNLRCEEKLDVATSPWPALYGACLSFARHNLSDYDRLCTDENRETLRAQIHPEAQKTYPWLRPDTDPRLSSREPTASNAKESAPRILNELSAELAALVSRRAQILMRISELKRKKPLDGKVRVKELVDRVKIAHFQSDVAYYRLD